MRFVCGYVYYCKIVMEESPWEQPPTPPFSLWMMKFERLREME